jgi:hypothetical protein
MESRGMMNPARRNAVNQPAIALADVLFHSLPAKARCESRFRQVS